MHIKAVDACREGGHGHVLANFDPTTHLVLVGMERLARLELLVALERTVLQLKALHYHALETSGHRVSRETAGREEAARTTGRRLAPTRAEEERYGVAG